MKLEWDEILSVIDKVKDTGVTAFEYQDDDIRLKVKNGAVTGVKKPAGAVQDDEAGVRQAGTRELSDTAKKREKEEEAFTLIESPMVGTFYSAASEKSEPFVSVGDTVKPGQTVGIVEAMKLMNEIEAQCGGVVEEILVQNGQMVEYGQPLMRVRAESGSVQAG